MAIQNWPKTSTSSDWANVDSIKWPEAMLPPDVNDSARAMGRDLAKFRDDINSTSTTSGSSNAYTLTSNGSYTTLANGFQLSFKASFSNTAAATLNVDSLGAKAIRKFTTTGEAALGANDIVSGGYYWVQYNTAANSAAGGWILLNPSFPPPSGMILKVATYTDAGSSSTSTSMTNANGGAFSFTPTSTSSTIVILASAYCTIGAIAATNTSGQIEIRESGSLVGSTYTFATAASTDGASWQGPVMLQVSLSNSSTSSRSFSFYHKSSSGSATVSTTLIKWTIMEIAS